MSWVNYLIGGNHGWNTQGDRFTKFVDEILRSTIGAMGLPDAIIKTNSKTNIPDGGVDTEITEPLQGDPTGWASDCRTIWQYKVVEVKSITQQKLQEEINKKYVQELIKKNYGSSRNEYFCPVGQTRSRLCPKKLDLTNEDLVKSHIEKCVKRIYFLG